LLFFCKRFTNFQNVFYRGILEQVNSVVTRRLLEDNLERWKNVQQGENVTIKEEDKTNDLAYSIIEQLGHAQPIPPSEISGKFSFIFNFVRHNDIQGIFCFIHKFVG